MKHIYNCNSSGNLDSCINQLNIGFQDAVALQEIMIFDTPLKPIVSAFYFYFATCSQYCFYEDYNYETSTSFLNYKSMPCTDGCCKRSLIYKYVETGIDLISVTTQQISGRGCDYVLQAFPCPANSTITATCVLECD